MFNDLILTRRNLYEGSHKMLQNKISPEDDWNISCSDDEEDLHFSGRNGSKTDPGLTEQKKRKKKINNFDVQQPIPKSIALLYADIEKSGWIELTCKCPRRGPTKRDSQSQGSQSSTSSIVNKIDNYHISPGQSSSKQKTRPECQGFDYKEDEERPFVTKNSSAKKTPVSGKRAKKIASMTNVVNDLIRHKMLDDLESSTTEKDQMKTKTEEKDSRLAVDFDSQESALDMKEGIASQISRVETMLDSKESKKVKGKDK